MRVTDSLFLIGWRDRDFLKKRFSPKDELHIRLKYQLIIMP
jgi:hypothetical protein